MLTYFLLARLSLWAPLSPAQRRFVWEQCIHPMLIRWPMMVARPCLLGLALVFGKWAGASQSWLGVGLVFLAGILLGDLVELALIFQRRQRVRQYLKDHAAEIQSVG